MGLATLMDALVLKWQRNWRPGREPHRQRWVQERVPREARERRHRRGEARHPGARGREHRAHGGHAAAVAVGRDNASGQLHMVQTIARIRF